MRIVFDIDDTISRSRNGDYANAIPDLEVIEKINTLYDEGIEIYLYTSRGMLSCNENLDLIKEKNQDILIDWLSRYKVKYHQLIFGKPLADLYVDDKAMNIQNFKKESFYPLKGGSGQQIYKMGSIVKKQLENKDKLEEFLNWIQQAENMCNYPKFISATRDNNIYYNYIEGQLLNENFTNDKLLTLILTISNFKNKKYNNFNLKYHFDVLDKNLIDNLIENKINYCKNLLKEKEDLLQRNASFSHGDTILSNIIENNNLLYFIDPQFNINASSYLMDFAKLRMSLDNYEYNFNISKNKLSQEYKDILDNYLKINNIYDIVVILEYMYIIRLYRYKKEEEKKIVLQMLNNLEEEQEWKID